MSVLKIYIDINYPKKLVDALINIHQLKKPKQYQIVHWTNQNLPSANTGNAILLFVNRKKQGIEIPIQKHFEDGYRVFACRLDKENKPDLFEFAMTVLRVWPSIIEASEKDKAPFVYSFNYANRRLTKIKTLQ